MKEPWEYWDDYCREMEREEVEEDWASNEAIEERWLAEMGDEDA